MKLNYSLGTAFTALLFAGGVTAASAQVVTLYNPAETTTGSYVYTYSFTTPVTINELFFNFGDPNVTFDVGNSSSGPLTLNAVLTHPSAGVFGFDSSTLNAGFTQVFAFDSSDGPTGGTTGVGMTGISFSGAGIVSGSAVGPVAAPEPGTFVSLAVLGTCLGLGIVARKRKMVA